MVFTPCICGGGYMKNKAKWTALLMCGILLFSGCNSVNDKDSTDAKDVVTQATEAPEETPAPDTDATEPTKAPVDPVETPAPTEAPTNVTETPAPTEAPAISDEQSTIPHITILPEEKILCAEDGTTLLTITDYTLSVDSEGFDNLQAAFDNYHPGIVEEDHQLLYTEAAEFYEMNPEFFRGYSSNYSATLSRCDSNLVSFRVLCSDYTGGAHGMYAYYGETYDVESGQQLLLTDIVADAEGFYPSAIDYINNALYEEYQDGLFAGYQSAVETALSPSNEPLWYMTSTGIVICFTPYEVGPYAMGAPEITLPYSECAAYLHSKYLPSDGELIAKVGLNQDISSLIGVEQPVMIEAVDNDWRLDISLVSGSSKASLGTFGYFHSAYMIRRADGRSFLFITCDYMSDDYVTYLYVITDGNPIIYGELPNMLLTGRSLSSKNIEMEVRVDALGSYRAFANFMLTPEATLTHDGDIYRIDSEHVLNIIKPLPVTINGVETTLDAGTQITITGTNLSNEIYFKVTTTEQTGTIHYTHEEPDTWIHLIDGISEYEYFEDLPYAG